MRFVRQAAAVSAAAHPHSPPPQANSSEALPRVVQKEQNDGQSSDKPARVPFLSEETWPDFFLMEAAKAEQQIRLRELLKDSRASNFKGEKQ